MEETNKRTAKEIILLTLDFFRDKVENDRCTPAELRNVTDAFAGQLRSEASIDELAEFFGQSSSNVRNLICRRYAGKPRRRVFYDFFKFVQIIPQTWKR